MAKREVTKSGKDEDGDITKLCNSGQPWSPRYKNDAIKDIEDGVHSYYVNAAGTREAQVKVVTREGKKYLRTVADADDANNLDNLPDC